MRLALSLLALLAAACAGPRAGSSPALARPGKPPSAPTLAPSPAAPGGTCLIARGMDREALLRCMGKPAEVERRSSSAVEGLGYEDWIYRTAGDNTVREIWLADGKVIDVTVSETPR